LVAPVGLFASTPFSETHSKDTSSVPREVIVWAPWRALNTLEERGSTALLLSLVTVVLVSFDSLNAAVRVLGWPFAIPTCPERGYYLLEVGSAMGAVLSGY
jgi:hypothetical protein